MNTVLTLSVKLLVQLFTDRRTMIPHTSGSGHLIGGAPRIRPISCYDVCLRNCPTENQRLYASDASLGRSYTRVGIRGRMRNGTRLNGAVGTATRGAR